MLRAVKALVVYCHPNPKSYTHAVLTSVQAGLAQRGAEVQTLDLYASGFDPVLVVNEEHRRRDLDKVEYTRTHREQLAWCDTLISIYPVWWGGMPAMLKGWLDRTFVSGLCYSFKDLPKTKVFPTGLMKGKRAHFFYTLDSPALVALVDPGWWSNYFTVFKYCGFSQVKRHYLARLKLTTQAQREAWLTEVQRRAAKLSSGA